MSYPIPPEDSRCHQCQQQLDRYRVTGEQDNDVSSCNDVLALALDCDQQALDCLLAVTATLARRHCPSMPRELQDDWIQEVLITVNRKLTNRINPYIINHPPPQPFVAYQKYVAKVVLSTKRDFVERLKREQSNISLDQTDVPERTGSEPGIETRFVAQEQLQRIFAAIPDPQHCLIFRLRYAGYKPPEIASFLAQRGLRQDDDAPYTTDDVYRIIERTNRYVRKLPELRDIFTSDGNN